MTAVAYSELALEDLSFTNAFARLPDAFREERTPSGLRATRLVAVSPDAARSIGLAPAELQRDEFLEIASGRALLRGMQPVAAMYGGHQFGVWAGQLGDGRAITLGEVTTAAGEPWELQLKGAGQTMFSRFADGRAVVRSTVREFLASEAMDALGVPTTRALAMVASDEDLVIRETVEKAAIVLRLAPSFVRFGSFEIFAARGNDEAVKTLADFVIDRFYPQCGGGADRYEIFFQTVLERTARLMAAWQCVGFMHGVMNTDNFSILGLTLDYGPYGFMEAYEPGRICNHTDEGGRYAYDRQPSIGLWNCYALANALAKLIDPKRLEAMLQTYVPAFRAAYEGRMRAKLGLATIEEGDDVLAADLRAAMAAAHADWTRTFRALADLRTPREAEAAGCVPLADAHRAAFAIALGGGDAARGWLARYDERLARETRGYEERAAAIRAASPRIVLRNHLAQEAIVAAEAGDGLPTARLLAALRRPFDDDPAVAAYDRPAPHDEPEIVVSCSS